MVVIVTLAMWGVHVLRGLLCTSCYELRRSTVNLPIKKQKLGSAHGCHEYAIKAWYIAWEGNSPNKHRLLLGLFSKTSRGEWRMSEKYTGYYSHLILTVQIWWGIEINCTAGTWLQAPDKSRYCLGATRTHARTDSCTHAWLALARQKQIAIQCIDAE